MKKAISALSCEQVYNIWSTEPDLIQVIDLRSRPEFDEAHIPGALHSDLEGFAHQLRRLGSKLGVVVAPEDMHDNLKEDFGKIGQWLLFANCDQWQKEDRPTTGRQGIFNSKQMVIAKEGVESLMTGEMIFHQMFEPESSTFTYLLADANTKEAVLIDPVVETVERDLKLVDELGLKLLYVLDTHVHADHITAAAEIRKRSGAKIAISQAAGVKTADILLEDGQVLLVGKQKIQVIATPGHTDSCVSYYTAGRVFTGDTLLIRGTGRTDFQQGSAEKLYESVTQKLFTLPDTTIVYPGHDYRGFTSSTIGDEKRHNPRLGGGRSKDQFVKIMSELKLAYPKKIDQAVPANLVSGQIEQKRIMHPQVVDGIPEVTVEDVKRHLGQVRLIDVRRPDEFTGELQHIPGAELVTLGPDLLEFLQSGTRDEEIVFVCRSGGRSGQATEESIRLGYTKTANMVGGMLKWNEFKFPTES